MVEQLSFHNEQSEPLKVRNNTIRQMIEAGETPMLAFEKQKLLSELLGHVATQGNLTEMLGEAMSTTSETWHDNAQADAIVMQSAILEKQAGDVIQKLHTSRVVDVYEGEHSTVTIGSVAELRLNRSPMSVLLLGSSRELPEGMENDELMVVNMSSPIGRAIFDKEVGEDAHYEVNGRQFTVTINSIDSIYHK